MKLNLHEHAMLSFSLSELRAYCEADPSFVFELDEMGFTPLIAACVKQMPEAVDILLEFGSDPNFRTDCGSTPLTCAVPHPDSTFEKRLFDLLLEAGADINNSGYETPLHSAVCSRHLDLVGYLIQKGANPNLEDADGSTPLHMAGYGNLDAKMIRLLVELGADIQCTDGVMNTLGDWIGEDRLNEILAGR